MDAYEIRIEALKLANSDPNLLIYTDATDKIVKRAEAYEKFLVGGQGERDGERN